MSVNNKVRQKYWSTSVRLFGISDLRSVNNCLKITAYMTELVAMNQKQLSWILKMINNCNLLLIVFLPQTIPQGENWCLQFGKYRIFRRLSSVNNYVREQLCP